MPTVEETVARYGVRLDNLEKDMDEIKRKIEGTHDGVIELKNTVRLVGILLAGFISVLQLI